MDKKVRGSLFGKYVRMARSAKEIDWSQRLAPGDQAYLEKRIEDNEWYPLDVYERIGLAILSELEGDSLESTRTWGQSLIDNVYEVHESMICEEDPTESLVRYQVYRRTFYNFDPLKIMLIFKNYAKIKINRGMESKLAEQAACYQSLGSFERLLELSGAAYVQHRFTHKSWSGDPDTILELIWSEVSRDSKVKGVIFLDYVRMLKSKKDADWSKHLTSADLAYLSQNIAYDQWYPLESFERMGVAILDVIAGGDVDQARAWGRFSMDHLFKTNDSLVVKGDPGESLMRFQVLRRSYFTFETISISYLGEGYAKISISYRMSNRAEKPAAYQTLGFFESLFELCGVTNLRHNFLAKSWEGDSTTVLELDWRQ